MKTTRILLLATTLLLFPWCASQVFAQQNEGKKIVITKRTIGADGSESSETIVKKGAAAENFDVDQYIRENRADYTQVEVKITGGDDERSIVVKGAKSKRQRDADEREEDEDDDEDVSDYLESRVYEGLNELADVTGVQICSNKAPFLGVDEDSDEKAGEPGLVVNVVRGSAADRAGLHDNDKIMKLNNTPVNQWTDLVKFVESSKTGDKVQIAYERNGKAATTEATLTRRDEVKYDFVCESKGFLGVSDRENRSDLDKPGVTVYVTKGSAADKAGLQSGDVIFQLGDAPISDFEDISDYMAYTKPGEKTSVTYERNGKRNTVEATLGEQKNSWNIGLDNLNMGSWSESNGGQIGSSNKGNCTVTVRQKDACLGVYTEDFEDKGTNGALINDFTEASAALEAKLEKGDVITGINGQRVKSHEALWNEIAKLKIGDKVKLDYQRDGKSLNAEATLKACRDNSSRVQVTDDEGEQVRDFTSWNWNEDDQQKLRERSIITIRRGEGDVPKVNLTASAQERSLKLSEFRIYPNPTEGQVTLEFSAEAVATTVSFYDLSGKQLFREELNAFNGRYNQQFDLSDYSNGTIVVQVQQGDKVYSDQMVVN